MVPNGRLHRPFVIKTAAFSPICLLSLLYAIVDQIDGFLKCVEVLALFIWRIDCASQFQAFGVTLAVNDENSDSSTNSALSP